MSQFSDAVEKFSDLAKSNIILYNNVLEETKFFIRESGAYKFYFEKLHEMIASRSLQCEDCVWIKDYDASYPLSISDSMVFREKLQDEFKGRSCKPSYEKISKIIFDEIEAIIKCNSVKGFTFKIDKFPISKDPSDEIPNQYEIMKVSWK